MYFCAPFACICQKHWIFCNYSYSFEPMCGFEHWTWGLWKSTVVLNTSCQSPSSVKDAPWLLSLFCVTSGPWIFQNPGFKLLWLIDNPILGCLGFKFLQCDWSHLLFVAFPQVFYLLLALGFACFLFVFLFFSFTFIIFSLMRPYRGKVMHPI